MNLDPSQIIPTAIVTAIVTACVSLFVNRQDNETKRREQLLNTYEKIIDQLQEERTRLDKLLEQARKELQELRDKPERCAECPYSQQ